MSPTKRYTKTRFHELRVLYLYQRKMIRRLTSLFVSTVIILSLAGLQLSYSVNNGSCRTIVRFYNFVSRHMIELPGLSCERLQLRGLSCERLQLRDLSTRCRFFGSLLLSIHHISVRPKVGTSSVILLLCMYLSLWYVHTNIVYGVCLKQHVRCEALFVLL